jgi:serine phosphatase RsbU (regulator of sigma subunit)
MIVPHPATETAPEPDVLLSRLNLREALVEVRQRLEVDVATVLRLDPASHHLVTVLTESTPRVTPVHHRVPLGRGLAGRVAELGAAVVLDDVRDDDLVNPVLLTLGVHSVLAVPVRNRGEVTGVLKVGTRVRRPFSPEEISLAQALASDVNTALETYYAADERAAAAALQRSLVPASLPAIEGLDMAGRYVPGRGDVSGDWYDVFSLPGGRVGIVMGDVAGHGLPASVVMGRLRSALRAYALEYDDPAEVLSHLDAKIMHFEPGAMATAVYAVTQPPYDRVQVSSAGHFLPILLEGAGPADQVDLPVGLPLGVDPDSARPSGTVCLDPGALMVLFTDGLVERRSTSTQRGSEVFDTFESALAELCHHLRPEAADAIASRILDVMLTIEPPGDDVAVLVVRRSDEER